MPYRFTHTLFKSYIDTIRSESKSKAHAEEQAMDEIEDAMM
jgi:hypothetical protein